MNWCNRCGHAWKPRKQERSKECPCCQCTDWDKEQIGSRLSFKFNDIEVGQTKLYEWFIKNGRPDNVNNAKINKALTTYIHRSKRQFIRKPDAQGLHVTRIS